MPRGECERTRIGHRATFGQRLCLLLMGRTVMVRPRWRRRVVEVHRYRHRMENRVGARVRDEV